MFEYVHMNPNFGRNKLVSLVLFLPIVAFVLVLLSGREYAQSFSSATTAVGPVETPTMLPKVFIGDIPIEVELSNTGGSIRFQGLSGRNQLSEDQGMLFIFDTENVRPTVIMKDMKFDIDIIWINDGLIAQIHPNVPAPASSSEPLPFYVPNEPIDYVLEMNAGSAEAYGFAVGDTVTLPNL